MALSVMTMKAQIFDVTGISRIGNANVEQVALSADGSFVLTPGAKGGIQRVDIATGESSQLTDGARVYDIAITSDGKNAVYNEATYKKQLRYVALKSVDLDTKKTRTLVKASRKLNAGIAISGNTVCAVENNKLKTVALAGKKTAPQAMVSINYGHLDLTVDGKTVTLDPQGRGSYLWPSLSPDGTKIVYWLVGRGAFVCDLQGNNIANLGELRAPVWAGNDIVIGMKDSDDGVALTASDIIAADLNGQRQTLTDGSVIAIYPSASADASRVAFSTPEGQLYIINLQKR